MMGVICGSDSAVKGAGHQQDKYKLKLMQVSFLLDQFAFGRLRGARHGALAIGAILVFHFTSEPRGMKVHIKCTCCTITRLIKEGLRATNVSDFKVE